MKTDTFNLQSSNVYQTESLPILRTIWEVSMRESMNLLESQKPFALKKNSLFWKAFMRKILLLLEGIMHKMEDSKIIENYNHNHLYPSFKIIKWLLYHLNNKI
jgi:hypothetical protein